MAQLDFQTQPTFKGNPLVTLQDFARRLIRKYKASDTTRKNTTSRTADPDLVAVLEADSYYRVEITLFYDGSPGGVTAEFSGPAGSTLVVTSDYDSTSAITGGLGVTFNLGTNNGRMANIVGFIKTTNSGNFSLLWAQTSSNATGSTVREGSHMILQKLNVVAGESFSGS